MKDSSEPTTNSLMRPEATASSMASVGSASSATLAIIDVAACCPRTDAAAKKDWVKAESVATRARITAESSLGAGSPPSSPFNASTPISSSKARQ